MKFSDLLKKDRDKLTSEEKAIIRELGRTYSNIKFNEKDKLTIDELRMLKTNRKEYTGERTSAKNKMSNLLSANEKLPSSIKFEYLAYTFPETKTLEQFDNFSNFKDYSKEEYLNEFKNRLDELKEFRADTNNSSVSLKKWERSQPTALERGTVNYIMREMKMAIYDKESLKDVAIAMQTIREISERRGTHAYESIWQNSDAPLDMRALGRAIREGGDEEIDAIKLINNMFKR